jgi:hypothetical protein
MAKVLLKVDKSNAENTNIVGKSSPLAASSDYLAGGPIPGSAKEQAQKALLKIYPEVQTELLKSSRIPLPNYKDSASRLKYAQAWRDKYGSYMQGRGDTPLRINEVPNTEFDRLPIKQSAINAAKKLGLDPALFYSSAMEEGVSGMFKKGYEGEGYFNSSSYRDFPVSGFAGVGLDHFGGNFQNLVKKGYLSPDFAKRFQKTIMTNEKGEETQSGDFRSVEDALKAKAAMVKDSEDQISNYAKRNNIQLSPKAKQFFTYVNYNAGEGNAQKMLMDYYKSGALNDDSYLNNRPTSGPNINANSWKQPYDNVIRRIKMAQALKDEGYFDEETPTPANQKVMLQVRK